MAIVTGGNGGIGKGIARGLAGAGAAVVIAARDEARTAAAVAEIQRDFAVEVLGVATNVRHEQDNQQMVQKTLDRFGRIDILVCNAGRGGGRPAQEMTVAEWDEILETNLRSFFIASKAVYPTMVRQGGGKIIGIGSLTSLMAIRGGAAYGASKGGVVQIARSLAVGWARDNIQVNCILPGWVRTDMTERSRMNKAGFISGVEGPDAGGVPVPPVLEAPPARCRPWRRHAQARPVPPHPVRHQQEREMKSTTELSSWQIVRLDPCQRLSEEWLRSARRDGPGGEWIEAQAPAQVHEILLSHGMIKDPSLLNAARECLWVAESDWVYRCAFAAPESSGRAYLRFGGLDTLVDVYLNEEHVAYHDDMYVPLEIDVTGRLKKENFLILHFHSPHDFIKRNKLPAEWVGKVKPNRLIRKDDMDFSDYLGVKPYLTRIGVYDRITFEVVDELEIREVDVATSLADGYRSAAVDLAVRGRGHGDGARLRVDLLGPDRKVVATRTDPIAPAAGADGDAWTLRCRIVVKDAQLWWPRGYGSQPLYDLTVSLVRAGETKDVDRRRIGFRDARMVKPFDFVINGRTIKLWGAQPAQVQGITHCWNSEKARITLDMAENCNMNALRIWGGSDRYGDDYYDEADRRGILIWQEFFHDYGMYPDTREYRDRCRKEVEFQVKRLKHHPCLLFWCGGNESIMGAEFDHPGEKCIGIEIFTEDYRKVCETLDPQRYFHISSPSGGSYANDPLGGDTHSYTNQRFVPGSDYPVMVAEEIRASAPSLKSLLRYLPDGLAWPKGYSGMVTKDGEYPWPDTWTQRTGTQAWKKIPEIERFYDSDDLESAVYKFGAAHALYLRRILENNRRGKPSERPDGERICKGHFVCRWNDCWPIIYGSMLDYYLEPYMPYYATKRAYEPVLLSFDIQNFIYLWIVNDTPGDVEGTVSVGLFNMAKNAVFKETRREVRARSGESKVITDLNEFGQFFREYVLYARMVDRRGNVIAWTHDFADIERHLKFPDAKLEVQITGNELSITTDRFARCVELGGDDDGDEFGWVFEDNYFDLLPGEAKKVRILGRHKRGTITAKPHFSGSATSVEYA